MLRFDSYLIKLKEAASDALQRNIHDYLFPSFSPSELIRLINFIMEYKKEKWKSPRKIFYTYKTALKLKITTIIAQ